MTPAVALNLPSLDAALRSEDRAFNAASRSFLRPLLPLIDDPEVSEIMVNGHDCVYAERRGRISPEPSVRFRDEHELTAAAKCIAQYVGKTIGPDRPILDGRLPDGSRVCVVLSPIPARGTSINIRKFSRKANVPEFLIQQKSAPRNVVEFLVLAVKACQNILVSGGTGTGKTTLVNILATAFATEERVVVIEDTRELQFQHGHVVQLEARPADRFGRGEITVRDLFRSALRMRPDRIVVGEVRGGEALDMIQAMTSGHRGSLATLHANTPADACRRLETMAMLADISIPLFALRRQVASAVDLIVQIVRIDRCRRISQVCAVDFDEDKESYLVTDLFTFSGLGADELQADWTAPRPEQLCNDLRTHGAPSDAQLLERIIAPNHSAR